MKKNYKFDVMSDRDCMSCYKPLKKRMVEEHDAKVCWTCVKKFMRKWGLGRTRTLHRLGIFPHRILRGGKI